MKRYLEFACSCAMFLIAVAANGQQVEGYTTVDIDPSTNAVTATCETSIDSDYYASFVSCAVTDGNGTQITSGSQIDNYGYEGYAQVVLTFTGTAGTTYLATGVHSAQPTMPFDTPEPQPGRPVTQYYDDPYNYNSFDEGTYQTYAGSFDLYGPGPDQQVKRKPLHIADTTADSAIAPVITVKFIGAKSSGDNLMFASAGLCSEGLGLGYCPGYQSRGPRWNWRVEISAPIKDDASKWTVTQQILGGVEQLNEKNGSSISYGQPVQIQPSPDPFDSAFLQQPSGGKYIFALDAPGFGTTDSSSGATYPVDSGVFKLNLLTQICSAASNSICSSQTWYVEIVINPGQQISSASSANYGSAP